jgi:hypothetical protein
MQIKRKWVGRMSELRFGKVEKWILKHAYLKTVKKEMPDNWREIWCECIHKDKNWPCGNCLLKAEILKNYFGDKLTESSVRKNRGGSIFPEFEWVPIYQADKSYKSALVILDRVFKSLERKGLIEKDHVNNGQNHIGIYRGGILDGLDFGSYEPTKIVLTDKGRLKVNSLLNINK